MRPRMGCLLKSWTSCYIKGLVLICKCDILKENISEVNLSFYLLPIFLKDGKAEKADTSTSGKASMKSILENLSDLWDQEQYDSEYSLENFMHSLK
jgi:hypothetical protein